MNHRELIAAYYAAWARDDIEAVLALCTEDVTAVNVPMGPIHGKPAVRDFLVKFGRGMSNKRYVVERILTDANSAMVEGVEHYVKQDRSVSLPYMSLFRFANGQISEWRDYFDLQTVLRQLQLPLDGTRRSSGTTTTSP